MLDKLEFIANELDELGMYKEAETVTVVMKRVAQHFGHEDGPIRDFQPHDSFGDMPSLNDAMTGDNLEIMGIHAALKAMHVDPSGMTDEAAKQVYQALMNSQMSQAFAATKRVKKTA